MIRWSRRTHRPRREPEESGFDAWPALVDVLAAAFVFLLLAFFGLLTRDVVWQKSAGEALARQAECARQRAAHDEAVSAWTKLVVEAQRKTVSQYLLVLKDLLEQAGIDDAKMELLLKACRPGPAVDKLDDGDQEAVRRRDVLITCGIQSGEDKDDEETLIHFGVGEAEPDYADGLLTALRDTASDLLDRSCSQKVGSKEVYCAAGFEIAGHADCIGTDAGRRYWKLSTDRAGSVIQHMMTPRLAAAARTDLAFQIQASGYETRVASNTACSCDKSKTQWSQLPSCLAENRRVELRIRLKTPEMPGRPKEPVCDREVQ